MKIYYNDENFPQLLKIYTSGLRILHPSRVIEYSYGMRRAQPHLVKEYFSDYFRPYGYSIGKKTEHAHGIGNNNANPIMYQKDKDNIEIVGYINLNSDMYGGVYAYLTDYNDCKVSDVYFINEYGVKKDGR